MAAQSSASGSCHIRRSGWPRLPRRIQDRETATMSMTPETPLPPACPAEGIASDPDADLQFPLAAAAALYRADRRAGRLCGAVPERTVASVRALLRFQRTADHARGARPDRRRDDLEPAGDGDRRRLRDVRLAAQSGRTSGPAGMAQPRQRQRAQDQARDGDHRHLVDPSVAHLHRGRRIGLGQDRHTPKPA